MLNFKSKDGILPHLEKLTPETEAKFGVMTAQHMVEHLILLMKISTGKLQIPLSRSEESAETFKQQLIYTDMKFPKGVKAKGIPEDQPLPLRYENLEVAIDKLISEIDDFHSYFGENPEQKTLHPVLNWLNYEEWKIFHSKHFTHHFEQFGLFN